MSPTLLQVYEQFFLSALVEGTTKRRCKVAIRRFVKFAGKEVMADALDGLKISQWQLAMKEDGLSNAYIRSSFAAVSQVCSWAVGEHLLASNPFAAAKKIRADKLEVRTFTADEAEALCNAAATLYRKDPSARLRWYALLLICGESGLRIGEALNLRWEDIDLDAEMLHVVYRADKAGEYWTWGTKGKHDRLTPMSQELINTFYRLREIAKWRYPILKRYTCLRLQAKIGSIPEHIRKMPYTNLYREFRQVKAEANRLRKEKIGDGCFHKLRKTAVTGWALDGVPMLDAKTVAGHESEQTTRRYYVAVDILHSANRVREAIARRATA